MSLVSLMFILYHRDHRMTLGYAAITQETVHGGSWPTTSYDESRAMPAATEKPEPS
jgi:hypothetical protein